MTVDAATLPSPVTMDRHGHTDFDQYFDFELASGSNAFSLEELDGNASLFPEPDTLRLSQNSLPALVHRSSPIDSSDLTNRPRRSYSDFHGENLPCTSGPPDTFDGMVLADMDDLPINVPSFWRPAAPCDYCASRQLDCFFLIENQNCCNSCTSLFRACSFSNPAARAPRGYLDTLSSVAEDAPQDTGLLTSTKPLFSLGASMNDILDDISKSKPERTTTRFPRSTLFVLRKWLEAHSERPYPTEEEKEELKEQTGLSRNQISNWLANARRRGKVRPKKPSSPSISPLSSSRPINIPNGTDGVNPKHQAHLTPFERWKESPPENEPASISAISHAASKTQFTPEQSGSSSQSHSVADQHRSSTSAGSAIPAPSISSLETGRSGRSSGSKASTNGSSYSYGSRSSFASYGARDRRRRRRTVPKVRQNTQPQAQRIFQCTFCTDTFHIKYDWVRHEKSLHLSLEKYMCAPIGPVVTSGSDGSTQCVYCQAPNPTKEHIDMHNHSECEEKGLAARTFFRKDHLKQHLRLIHNVPLNSDMEAWKSAPDVVRSRCGFCTENSPTTFTTWQDRADHLAKHFREGARMTQWKGDWGFEPHVATQVTNAMPPWMIGEESNSPDPFTASGGGSTSQMGFEVPRDEIPEGQLSLGRAKAGKISTCWEVLTVMLGKFVKMKLDAGEAVPDGDLQRQARIFLYGEDDEWNQTAADNAEWLRLFKQAHGIGEAGKPVSTSRNASIGKRDSVGSELISPQTGGFTVDGGGTLLTPQDDVDEQFRQIFEDSGIFGMDMGVPSNPQACSFSGFAPTGASPHLDESFWTMQSPDTMSYDFDNSFGDNQGHM